MNSEPLILEFPLRAGVLAQVVVPSDMTPEEAARLSRFIESLPIPSGDPWPELLP